jgi:hypothetical protein
MDYATFALRLLHFLGMALWFVSPLAITGDLRKSIARGKPHTDVVVQRVERALGMATIGAIITILSGLGMIFVLGGFKGISPRIHAGFGLALITLAVEFFLLKGAVGRLGEAFGADASKDVPSAMGKVGMFAGITHALKLVILVLMVIRPG